MKIEKVAFDNRRQAFRIEAGGRSYELPYAAMGGDRRRLRVVRAFADPELGLEGFTFETAAGEIGAVHMDNVLHHAGDPRAHFEDILYRLTIEAEDALTGSGISKRAVARRLGTSMSQLSRLLDATNTSKSLEQMIALLAALGRETEIVVRPRKPGAAA